MLDALTAEIIEARELGVELALVVGGGNFFRGAAAEGIDRVTADQPLAARYGVAKVLGLDHPHGG